MEAMVLGVHHFNSLSNQFRVTDDITTESRKQEISDLINRLVDFSPTKIAVEQLQSEQPRLDQEYADFVRNGLELPLNEVYQLGFRAAKQLGHERVYAIDYKNELSELTIGDVFEFAEGRCPELHKYLNNLGQKFIGEMKKRLETKGVREALRWMNEPDTLRIAHQPYLVMTQVGDDSNRIGLKWVSRWYERNLTIYSNLMNHTANDDERWLIIYGQGHAPLLTQFLSDSKVKLVPVTDYL